MRIYIITDLEGAAMVSRWDQTRLRDASPDAMAASMKLLTWEVNAAVGGILEAVPGAEVVVWDGHGSGGIDIMEFHDEARLIPRGEPTGPPYFLDPSYDAVFFVGQHAMAGTPDAPLCHTYSSKAVEYYKINGVPVGEFGARAIMAGTLGVPTVFLSGDDKAAEEAAALIPGIHCAVVKQGLGIQAALHLSPKASQELIRKTAAEAVKDIETLKPPQMDPPYVQEISVKEREFLRGFLERGAKRTGPRTAVVESEDICDLLI